MKIKVLEEGRIEEFEKKLQKLINKGWKPIWETFQYFEVSWEGASAFTYIIILKR